MSDDGVTEDVVTVTEDVAGEDVATEEREQSWFERLRNSCAGIIIGIALLCGSVPLLVWNEGRSLRRYKALVEGAKVVVPLAADAPVDPYREGSLVHIAGAARAGSAVVDPTFGISADGALRLRRDVDMYQWVEHKETQTRKKSGGGTKRTTRYTYQKEWESGRVDSNEFYRSQGHQNPSPPFGAFQTAADPITVGAFRLPQSMVDMLSWYSSMPSATLSTDNITDESIRSRARVYGTGYYLGNDPMRPHLGDVRVDFSTVPEGPISVLARQTGSTLSPYPTKAGKGSIFMLQRGTLSSEEMFRQAHQSNRASTWILRGVGFLLMFLGFKTVAAPMTVAADIIPCVGEIVECGVNLIALLLAIVFSLIVIALAWIAYRPFLGLAVVVVGGGLIGGIFFLRKKKSEEKGNMPESQNLLPVSQPVGTTYDDDIVVKPVPDEDVVVMPVPDEDIVVMPVPK